MTINTVAVSGKKGGVALKNIIIASALCLLSLSAFAEDPTQTPTPTPMIYKLNLASGNVIDVKEYRIDLFMERVIFTTKSNMNVTLPLDWLKSVTDKDVQLYSNPKTYAVKRAETNDGGIPAGFSAKSTTVNSGSYSKSSNANKGNTGSNHDGTMGHPQYVNNPNVKGGGYWRDNPSDRDGTADNKNQ
jgi:hypothetical protein